MDAAALLNWLSQHQATLTWLGGCVVTLSGGFWVVARHLLDRKDKRNGSKREQHNKFPPKTSAGIGGAAGRDLQIGGDFIVNHNRTPIALFGVAAIILLALVYMDSQKRADVHGAPPTSRSVLPSATVSPTNGLESTSRASSIERTQVPAQLEMRAREGIAVYDFRTSGAPAR